MRNYLSGTVLLALACVSCGKVQAADQDGGALDAANSSDASLIDGALTDAPLEDVDSGVDCPNGAICSGTVNYAFVTSEAYPAQELRTAASADGICNQLALEADLPGTYVAWLSADTENARTRLGNANGWIRPDRRPFAVSQSSLLDSHEIIHPLNMDENGMYSGEDARPVMTGSTVDGDFAEVCPEMAGTDDRVRVGLSYSSGSQWSFSHELLCTNTFRMYCFGVDNNSPITDLPVVAGRKAWVSSQKLSSGAGRPAMDAACAADAKNAGVTSPVIAFVARTNEPAVSRLNTNGTTWVRTDGVVLWEQASDILTQTPLAGISLLPNGAPAPGTGALGQVWTGALSPSDFSVLSKNCQNWKAGEFSTTLRGSVGDKDHVGPTFFFNANAPCGIELPVYCFER